MKDCEFRAIVQEALGENSQFYEEWKDSADTAKEGEYCDSMFQFVRRLRFHPQLRDLNPTDVADRLDEVLQEFSETEDPWQSAFDSTHSSPSWDTFVNLWAKVYQPIENDEPLAEAARRDLEDEELVVRETAKWTRGRAALRRFVSIAAHLQEIVGDQPMALPLGRLAEFVGVSSQRVSQLRENAVSMGILQPVMRHNHGAGKAATYWLNLKQVARIPRNKPAENLQ